MCAEFQWETLLQNDCLQDQDWSMLGELRLMKKNLKAV